MTQRNTEIEVTAPEGGSQKPQRRVLGTTILYAAVGILALMVVFLSFLLYRANNDDRERTKVLDVSRQFLVDLTTYSQSTIQEQRKKVLALATGRFSTEYDQTTREEFEKALRESNAESSGKVISVAVTSLEKDRATVFAIVEVSVTNKDLPAPRVDRNLIELSLVHTSSGWRVDGVTLP